MASSTLGSSLPKTTPSSMTAWTRLTAIRSTSGAATR